MNKKVVVSEESKFGTSVRGLEWVIPHDKDYQVKTLSQKLDIDEILARILVNRGVEDHAAAESYLEPKVRDLMPDPFSLKDCQKAAERIADAVVNQEKIAIFGDYDVDGATSSALLYRFFRMLNIGVEIYIPNRMKEGYGPNVGAFRTLKEQGVSLVITVDCGIVAFDALGSAAEMGLDVIVVDHHIGTETLPKAVAIVNPNRFDEDSPHKQMAAVGVSFVVAVAVRTVLRNRGCFQKQGSKEPDVIQLLDLVALGTVCDVVPLVGVNRAFVAQGLKLIATRYNLGMSVLADMVRLDQKPQSHHLGFIFGPRINAGGRVGEGSLGARLLATDSPEEAMSIVQRLEKLNEERKTIEALALEEAIAQIEENEQHTDPIVLAVGQGWHLGVLGILAGRLKERYNKPAAVISVVNGVGKGSARSIPGIDLGAAITNAKSKGILLDGGGHAMAGGFSVAEDMVDAFHQYLLQELVNVEPHIENAKKMQLDFTVAIRGITPELLDLINQAAPFGSGNPQPKVVVNDVYVLKVGLMRPNHIMLTVADKPNGGNLLRCIMFKGQGSPIANFLSRNIGKKVSVAGTLHVNALNKRKIDFILEDVASNG